MIKAAAAAEAAVEVEVAAAAAVPPLAGSCPYDRQYGRPSWPAMYGEPSRSSGEPATHG